MVKHVVMWKFKEENKTENLKRAKELLLSLPALIGEIRKMEVYIDDLHTPSSMDMMLETEFSSFDDLHTYAVHPEHLKVADFVKSVVESRVALDSEI